MHQATVLNYTVDTISFAHLMCKFKRKFGKVEFWWGDRLNHSVMLKSWIWHPKKTVGNNRFTGRKFRRKWCQNTWKEDKARTQRMITKRTAAFLTHTKCHLTLDQSKQRYCSAYFALSVMSLLLRTPKTSRGWMLLVRLGFHLKC